jgi:hypothetical protein
MFSRADRWDTAPMDTYEVETDGMGGFVVKVGRPDGRVYLTSPGLTMLSETRQWIDDHRKSTRNRSEDGPTAMAGRRESRLCPNCDNSDPSLITHLPEGAVDEAPAPIEKKIEQSLAAIKWCHSCRIVFLDDVVVMDPVANRATSSDVPIGFYYPRGEQTGSELEGWRRLRPGFRPLSD